MNTEPAPGGIIAKTIPFLGMCIRCVVKIPPMGKLLAASNRALGRLLPKLSALGFRRGESYENAVWNWETFLSLVGADYEVEETSPRARKYTIRACPAGHCRREYMEACRVTMELDSSLVESSGARLIVDKRYPIDGVCIERIVSNRNYD